MSRTALFASFALVLAALVSTPARAQEEPPGGPSEPMLEAPYTAAQIASACPAGRKIKLEAMIMGEAPGQVEKQFQVLEFKAVDATKATIVATFLDAKGQPTGDREETDVAWEDMRLQNEHPKAHTKRTEGELVTPAGTFQCWIYTVSSVPDDSEIEMGDTVFWYAKDRPGPAVKIEARLKDGKVAYALTVVEDSQK